MKRSMLGWIVGGLLAAPMAGHAAPVLLGVQGGFTSFRGCVLSGASQKVNGEVLVGDGATCSPFGDKYAGTTFDATTTSVTFQNYSFGLTRPSNEPNVISFTPKQPTYADSDPLLRNMPFQLGWLTFTNGVWTDDAELGFSITAYGGEEFGTQTFTGTLVYNLTTNVAGGDPRDNADYLTFVGNLQVGQLRAYELGDYPTDAPAAERTNTVTAELWGRFGSLHLDSFRNPTGGGFVVPGETSVPEPGTMALLALGLASLGAARRRKQ